jgi:hypothetical protein
MNVHFRCLGVGGFQVRHSRLVGSILPKLRKTQCGTLPGTPATRPPCPASPLQSKASQPTFAASAVTHITDLTLDPMARALKRSPSKSHHKLPEADDDNMKVFDLLVFRFRQIDAILLDKLRDSASSLETRVSNSFPASHPIFSSFHRITSPCPSLGLATLRFNSWFMLTKGCPTHMSSLDLMLSQDLARKRHS